MMHRSPCRLFCALQRFLFRSLQHFRRLRGAAVHALCGWPMHSTAASLLTARATLVR